jgi:phosphoribosyl 1,2-cyclic phosphodiesterase
MTQVCALASGSNGNCYYIGNNNEAVLIDAGISRRQIIDRMKSKGLNPNKVKAVFISHEHSDHYKGAKILSQKLNIPVYLSPQTLQRSFMNMRPDHTKTFIPGDSISIGDITVHSFLKQHDAIEPCSFRVEINNNHIGVFTDIGTACPNIKTHLNKCNFLFLESNYDDNMLQSGKYPAYLKKRVAGDFGHLSNEQAVKLVEDYAGKELKSIYLSHISADNNRGVIALDAFAHLSDKYAIHLTSRHAPSEVIDL